MEKYRKKPVIIEAKQLLFSTYVQDEIIKWSGGSIKKGLDGGLVIPTLEGDMIASTGDWIIKGIKGEFYPCKPDVFEKTYEPIQRATGKKTPEQLAREYMESLDFSNNTGIYIVNEMQGTAYQSYLDGYNSRNNEVSALKVALKEGSELIKFMLEEGGFGSSNEEVYRKAIKQVTTTSKFLKGE